MDFPGFLGGPSPVLPHLAGLGDLAGGAGLGPFVQLSLTISRCDHWLAFLSGLLCSAPDTAWCRLDTREWLCL